MALISHLKNFSHRKIAENNTSNYKKYYDKTPFPLIILLAKITLMFHNVPDKTVKCMFMLKVMFI